MKNSELQTKKQYESLEVEIVKLSEGDAVLVSPIKPGSTDFGEWSPWDNMGV